MKDTGGNLKIRRDKNGATCYSYRRRIRVIKNGKPTYWDIRKSLGNDPGKALAECKALDEFYGAMERGEKPKGTAGLGEFHDWYVKYLRDERKLWGWMTPAGHIKVFAERMGRETRLEKITRVDVESFLHDLKGKVSPSTVGNYHRSIRRMFNVAIQRNYLEHNPATGIRVEKPRLPEPWLPSKEEVTRLLDYLKVQRPKLYPVVVTLIFTGARLGEVITLDWSRVDFIGGTLTLVRRKVNDVHRLKMAKPLNEVLNVLWMESGMPKEGLVFLGKNDNIRERHSMFRSFKKVARSLGLPRLNLKTFRKLAATWTVQETGDVRNAQKLLGHTNLRTTEMYLGEGSKAQDAAVKAIEDRLSGTGKAG
jgi:integrase